MYDDLRRPVDTYVQPAVGSELLLSRTLYGESLATPNSPTTAAASELKLPLDPTTKNDWTAIASHTTIAAMATAAAPLLETTVYTSSSTHNALGRVLTAISPDGSEVAYTYNQRGALKTVDCKHRGSASSTPVVASIDLLYRLLEATGREHDGVGNLGTVVHAPASDTGWTRRYQYRTDGNRLVATSATNSMRRALIGWRMSSIDWHGQGSKDEGDQKFRVIGRVSPKLALVVKRGAVRLRGHG